jgi:hypothetical protein
MYELAEQRGLLAVHNAGFRKGKTTVDHLCTLVQALEDARLTGQNLYKLQIDFSNAFNTSDHDKLLCLLYDMGYPTDCIEVIKSIYSQATTFFSLPQGDTQPMPVERGTLQGDNLSPFLFLLYIEPMLRWLHVGGKGYRMGTLQGTYQVQHSISGLGFADDLIVICNTL